MHRRQPEKSNGIPHRISTASGPEWYPLQTRYQCEKKVDVALRNQGIESFAPTCLETRRWSDRTKLVENPFPGYTFVRMEADPELLVKVMRLPGLVRFVTCGRDLVAVPVAEINAVRALARVTLVMSQDHFPRWEREYESVAVALKEWGGSCVRSDRREIIISVGAIQRSLKVQLGNYRVERLD